MAKRKRSSRRGKNKGAAGKLWGYTKFLLLLGILAGIGFGIWYSQQDKDTQREAQEEVIAALDWLIELQETDKETDDFLNWIVSQIPASRGVVVSVGNIEGSDRYTFAGVPVGDRPIQILKNEGYLVGYDEEMQNPAWVAYHLKYRRGGRTADRPDGFEADDRTRARVEHHDYTNSGYDRGHMAPNYAIGMVYGEAAQMETFLMSNIVPQLPDLNRGPWKEVEQLIANDYLEESEELWVITGPIYGEPVAELVSGVKVPTAFYKVVIDEIDGNVRFLAWVMPQAAGGAARLSSYLVSVDEIESVTGLDFFTLLNDGVEGQLESVKAVRMW